MDAADHQPVVRSVTVAPGDSGGSHERAAVVGRPGDHSRADGPGDRPDRVAHDRGGERLRPVRPGARVDPAHGEEVIAHVERGELRPARGEQRSARGPGPGEEAGGEADRRAVRRGEADDGGVEPATRWDAVGEAAERDRAVVQHGAAPVGARRGERRLAVPAVHLHRDAHTPLAPPGCASATYTRESGTRRDQICSAPPAANTVVASPAPETNSAAAAATPTGARGNAGRACQASVAGSNATRGSTCTTALRRSPAAGVTGRGAETALSGTGARTARAVPSGGATGAAISPPPRRGDRTAPPPRVAPKPNPSITSAWPRTRIGSTAPST